MTNVGIEIVDKNLKRPIWRRLVDFDEAGLLLAFIIMVLVIGIPYPEFFRLGSIETVLRQTTFVAVIAFGMVFLVTMIEIDLSVSGIYATAAMSTALLIKAGINPWIAAFVALLAGIAMGALNGFLCNLLGVTLLIVSRGMRSVYFGTNFSIIPGVAVYGMPRDHAIFGVMGGDEF